MPLLDLDNKQLVDHPQTVLHLEMEERHTSRLILNQHHKEDPYTNPLILDQVRYLKVAVERMVEVEVKVVQAHLLDIR